MYLFLNQKFILKVIICFISTAQLMAQFPNGFQGTALPAFAGGPAGNFSSFRPQFSVPGQLSSSSTGVNPSGN